jgi:hypothetical protein
MADFSGGLVDALAAWFDSASNIDAAILYGSSARVPRDAASLDGWSDFDLHLIVTNTAVFDDIDWRSALPGQKVCFEAKRSATGGTNKLTVLFTCGQIDLVLLSVRRMRLARWLLRLGLHRKLGFVRDALNEMATSMRPGYRFLKGEARWGAFYARVVAEMPGVRLNDDMAREVADAFVIHMMLALTRLRRGELLAAQFGLHRVLSDTNLRLIRELRLRRNLPVPSFGLARRAEALFAPRELEWINVDARLEADALRRAIWVSFSGLKSLMAELVPAWRVPPSAEDLLSQHQTSCSVQNRIP